MRSSLIGIVIVATLGTATVTAQPLKMQGFSGSTVAPIGVR